MFILGLTGPSGAGKSYAAKVFESCGFTIVDADKAARQVVEQDSACLEELVKEYGREILSPDGSLNRRKLANTAFSDQKKLIRLNQITHPHIINLLGRKIADLSSGGTEFVLLDAPALFQSGADAFCNKVLTVTALINVRRQRIMERDGLSEEEANLRLGAVPEEYFTKPADIVIRNDNDTGSFEIALKTLASQITGRPAQGMNETPRPGS